MKPPVSRPAFRRAVWILVAREVSIEALYCLVPHWTANDSRRVLNRSYISCMINLTTLPPDIQAVILNGTLPEEVALFDLATDAPQCWEAQRRRIDEVVAKASANKTRAIALT